MLTTFDSGHTLDGKFCYLILSFEERHGTWCHENLSSDCVTNAISNNSIRPKKYCSEAQSAAGMGSILDAANRWQIQVTFTFLISLSRFGSQRDI